MQPFVISNLLDGLLRRSVRISTLTLLSVVALLIPSMDAADPPSLNRIVVVAGDFTYCRFSELFLV